MINGVKINLVYHFYCKNIENIRVGCGNVYNEINRRCLKHFHDVFDTATFCVCADNQEDSELIQKAIEWIWSCGFKENVVIKVKPNTPYRDAKTFYDEVVDHLSDIDGMVFFGHNKGSTFEPTDGHKQWVSFSYFSILDKIESHVKCLCEHTMVYTYVPYDCGTYSNNGEVTWLPAGTFCLINPKKVLSCLKRTGKEIPQLCDRFSAELFFPRIVNLSDEHVNTHFCNVAFEDWYNSSFVDTNNEIDYYHMDHFWLISYFLTQERVEEYRRFYESIIEGL